VTTAATTEQVLRFRDGIPGFPGCTRFVLTELVEGASDSPFQLLQCLDDPDVSMVVSVPWLFFPDYAPELSPGDERDLGLERPEDAVVFCAVTLEPDEDTVYLNLLGPFIVNIRTHEGRQVVLDDPDHAVRAAVPLGE
jgi:flagellar assembly factor FliW